MFVGIIYNWQGLKEENYVFSERELLELDPELWQRCVAEPEEWHPVIGGTADKTAEARLLKTVTDLQWFSSGAYNSVAQLKNDPNWYWENVPDNQQFYGFFEATKEAPSKRLF